MSAVKTVEKSLSMSELRKKAKTLSITSGKMKKAELIHSIQEAEGYTVCFGKSSGQCFRTECCFRGDCLKIR